MTRIPLLNPDDPGLDPKAKRLLEERQASMPGGLRNVIRAIANSPEALEASAAMSAAGYLSGDVTPAERELAYLTASLVNNCHY